MFKKKEFKELEIFCNENMIHTGEDARVLLDGEQIHHKYGMTQIRFDCTPETSEILIYYTKNPKNGKLFGVNENDEIIEKTIRIAYPVKRIQIDYKRFGVVSNNTPKGTEFFLDGKEIKESGLIEFHTTIGNAGEVNEFVIKGC